MTVCCRALTDSSRFKSSKAPVLTIFRTCGRMKKTVVVNETCTTCVPGATTTVAMRLSPRVLQ
jgi:hypothetical protein